MADDTKDIITHSVTIEKQLGALEDLLLADKNIGKDKVVQIRQGKEVSVTPISVSSLPYDETQTIHDILSPLLAASKEITGIKNIVTEFPNLKKLLDILPTLKSLDATKLNAVTLEGKTLAEVITLAKFDITGLQSKIGDNKKGITEIQRIIQEIEGSIGFVDGSAGSSQVFKNRIDIGNNIRNININKDAITKISTKGITPLKEHEIFNQDAVVHTPVLELNKHAKTYDNGIDTKTELDFGVGATYPIKKVDLSKQHLVFPTSFSTMEDLQTVYFHGRLYRFGVDNSPSQAVVFPVYAEMAAIPSTDTYKLSWNTANGIHTFAGDVVGTHIIRTVVTEDDKLYIYVGERVGNTIQSTVYKISPANSNKVLFGNTETIHVPDIVLTKVDVFDVGFVVAEGKLELLIRNIMLIRDINTFNETAHTLNATSWEVKKIPVSTLPEKIVTKSLGYDTDTRTLYVKTDDTATGNVYKARVNTEKSWNLVNQPLIQSLQTNKITSFMYRGESCFAGDKHVVVFNIITKQDRILTSRPTSGEFLVFDDKLIHLYPDANNLNAGGIKFKVYNEATKTWKDTMDFPEKYGDNLVSIRAGGIKVNMGAYHRSRSLIYNSEKIEWQTDGKRILTEKDYDELMLEHVKLSHEITVGGANGFGKPVITLNTNEHGEGVTTETKIPVVPETKDITLTYLPQLDSPPAPFIKDKFSQLLGYNLHYVKGGFYIIGGEYGGQGAIPNKMHAYVNSFENNSWTPLPIGVNIPALTNHKIVEYKGKTLLIGGRVPDGGIDGGSSLSKAVYEIVGNNSFLLNRLTDSFWSSGYNDRDFGVVVFHDKLCIFLDYYMLTSIDGIKWRSIDYLHKDNILSSYGFKDSVIVFNGKLYMVGQNPNRTSYVFSSTDGHTWKTEANGYDDLWEHRAKDVNQIPASTSFIFNNDLYFKVNENSEALKVTKNGIHTKLDKVGFSEDENDKFVYQEGKLYWMSIKDKAFKVLTNITNNSLTWDDTDTRTIHLDEDIRKVSGIEIERGTEKNVFFGYDEKKNTLVYDEEEIALTKDLPVVRTDEDIEKDTRLVLGSFHPVGSTIIQLPSNPMPKNRVNALIYRNVYDKTIKHEFFTNMGDNDTFCTILGVNEIMEKGTATYKLGQVKIPFRDILSFRIFENGKFVDHDKLTFYKVNVDQISSIELATPIKIPSFTCIGKSVPTDKSEVPVRVMKHIPSHIIGSVYSIGNTEHKLNTIEEISNFVFNDAITVEVEYQGYWCPYSLSADSDAIFAVRDKYSVAGGFAMSQSGTSNKFIEEKTGVVSSHVKIQVYEMTLWLRVE